MTPFESIAQLRFLLNAEKDDKKNDGRTISVKEHCERMNTFLDFIESSLEDAEYVYETESIDGEIVNFNDYTLFKKTLNDDVIIFQEAVTPDEDLIEADMESLAESISTFVENGTIKEDVILLAPNVNVFRARLKKPDINKEEENENDEE